MIATKPEKTPAKEGVVNYKMLYDIGGRVIAFRKLVHILKGKQDGGDKLSSEDLTAFKLQVSQLIEEDMGVLMGVIESLVKEGEAMLSLLHEVAAASKDDFDTIQMKCLKFLAQVQFEE